MNTDTETKIEGRGGPGRGQGRKPKKAEEVRKKMSITLPTHLHDWLNQQSDSQSISIEKALEIYILRQSNMHTKKTASM
jgi:hypothetical protein